MEETNADGNDYRYTLSFKCTKRNKCLAWTRLKAEVPWITYDTMSDGTVVATGDTIRTLQYGKYLRKLIQRSCILCIKRKQKHR